MSKHPVLLSQLYVNDQYVINSAPQIELIQEILLIFFSPNIIPPQISLKPFQKTLRLTTSTPHPMYFFQKAHEFFYYYTNLQSYSSPQIKGCLNSSEIINKVKKDLGFEMQMLCTLFSLEGL